MNTNVALRPTVTLTGPVAPVSNPVTGPDGTVYPGKFYGEVRACDEFGKVLQYQGLRPLPETEPKT